MIWKRLNDHGKNWRHVYKALVLLEYLIKTGSEKVARTQCYSSYILSSGGAAVQGEYICHPDPEGFPGAVLDLCHPRLFVLIPLLLTASCPRPFVVYLLSSFHCCLSLPVPLHLLLTSHCPNPLVAYPSFSSYSCCQFVEENKDQGLNVREKAKAMVSLLKVTTQ